MSELIVEKGNPLLYGCSKCGKKYNFTYSSTQNKVKLLIYGRNRKLKNTIELDENFKTGNIFACSISGRILDKDLYCYEENGIKKADIYAGTFTECDVFGKVKENAEYLSCICLDDFDWTGDKHPLIPYENSVIYKMHVRGFTKSRTSGVKHKGTFAGIEEKVGYLKELGVTAVELMPAYEFDEIHRFKQLWEDEKNNPLSRPITGSPVNYWGYCRALYFAPKSSYTSCSKTKTDYTVEFKNMVKTLHTNGIEVIMEMIFDDDSYGLIHQCVRYWTTQYHIDGIHIYASDETARMLASDPLLSNLKIISGFRNETVSDNKVFGCYNDEFSRTIRKFMKGDENQLADFVRLSGNNPSGYAGINYVTGHNGFTLMDLVSFDRKHNEENGENNKDGEDFNYSWNCGTEGLTKKKKINALRLKQMKNALTMLLMSEGTPLLMAGDEFCNSQNGNNNPYCMDSERSWINWNKSGQAVMLHNYVKKLIEFRMNNTILHMKKKLMASDPISCGYPDISWHGSSAWYQTMENYNRHIGIMYCTRYSCDYPKKNSETKNDAFELIYIAYNMHWEQRELALPKISEKSSWKLAFSTDDTRQQEVCIDDKVRMVTVPGRTVYILIAQIGDK